MKTLTNSNGNRSYFGVLSSAALAVCLVAFGSLNARAQNAKLQLGHLDKLASKASEVTNVNLEGPMLKLAAQQMSMKAGNGKSGKKVAVAELLEHLKGIYVKVFEFAKPGEYSQSDVNEVMRQLQSGGWKAIVHVEEKKSGETTGIYVMEEGGQTVGMAILAVEPKELTVVNLVGPINFSELGGLGSLGALGQLGGLSGLGNSKPQLERRNKSDQKPNPPPNPPGEPN